MPISPSINIGVGDLGSFCVRGIKDHIFLREENMIYYMSFQKVIKNEESLCIEVADNEGNFKKIDDENDVNNIIQNSYNDLIRLINQTELNPNFFSIHFNFYLSAYDKDHYELLFEFIKKIDAFSKKGVFQSVEIKCFLILSNGNGLINESENKLIHSCLDQYCELKSELNVVTLAFIIDDRNTQAVYLGNNYEYLPFALAEIILALMCQQSGMLNNLNDKLGIYAIGLGMLYFDKKYFKAFMRNEILKTKIDEEQINIKRDDEFYAKKKYIQFSKDILNKYCIGTINGIDLLKEVEELLVKDNRTLGDYKFILDKILHRSNESNNNIGLYNLEDAIYATLFYKFLTKAEIEEKGLISFEELKQLQTEISKLKTDQVVNKHLLQKNQEKIDAHFNAKSELLNKYIEIESRDELIEKIEEQKTGINEEFQKAESNNNSFREEYNNSSAIKRWFFKNRYSKHTRNFESNKKEYEERVAKLEIQKENINDIGKLFDLLGRLEKQYNQIEKAIESLRNLKCELETELEHFSFIKWVYIQNIISDKLLQKYELDHRNELQEGIENALLIIDNHDNVADFTRTIMSGIFNNVEEIIDFKIVEYMLGRYDKRELFRKIDFDRMIEKLKLSEYPFFNAAPGYTGVSHHLQYFNDENPQELKQLFNQSLSRNYNGPMPYFIKSDSRNKFALMTIYVIQELSQIVKYNIRQDEN